MVSRISLGTDDQLQDILKKIGTKAKISIPDMIYEYYTGLPATFSPIVLSTDGDWETTYQLSHKYNLIVLANSAGQRIQVEKEPLSSFIVQYSVSTHMFTIYDENRNVLLSRGDTFPLTLSLGRRGTN